MVVASVRVRDFRCYDDIHAAFGDELNVIAGPNGVGKTNLLEALYFGCTGRSCRTSNDRELIRFGAKATRVVVGVDGIDGGHELSVGLAAGQPKRVKVDGAPVDLLLEVAGRPLVSVFMPDRLELVKGTPSLRRGHLDRLVAALWPARVATRRGYAQALAQRNALLSRIRAGAAPRDSVASWDAQLARHGVALMDDRRQAAEAIAEGFTRIASQLGLDGEPTVRYRPRSRAGDAEELVRELQERLDGDLERGFTGHGPHRDELALGRTGRELRTYGSQGQQRLALLALLLAERECLAAGRTSIPVMLLDDVMSELDRDRRAALVGLLHETGGQAVITTTDLDHVPGVGGAGVVRIAVSAGRIIQDALGGVGMEAA